MAERFSFSKKFNKERIFDIDTSDFGYVSLQELYQDDETVYPVRGIYENKKSLYGPAVVLATDSFYVNLPSHLFDECKEILSDRLAVNEIKKGRVGFTIYKYKLDKYSDTFYSIRWVDINPDDFNTEETMDIEG